MTAPLILSIPDSDRNLDEFDPEPRTPTADTPLTAVMAPAPPPKRPDLPAPFSRVEAAAAVAGYCLALCAWIALRADSFASAAGRVSHRVTLGRTPVGFVEPDTFRAREIDGALVAAALGIVAVAYGGLLLTSWHAPAMPASASVVAVRQAPLDPIAIAAPPALPQSPPLRAVALPDREAEVRPRHAGVNATTLDAIWRRSDTRSLHEAFARLRRETLAFHSCTMQMTAADQAVARCDGVWTFDFRRSGDSWAIQRVSRR